MRFRNNAYRYGAVAVALHWLVALAVFAMFGLGWWMTGLTYDDPWYRLGPWWHKGAGVTLFVLVLLRLAWRTANPAPMAPPGHARWERRLAGAVHALLYLLLLAVMGSGYLISTADGRAVDVLGWFTLPAMLHGLEHQEDIAGAIHLALAWTLVGLAALHTLAALKHHFIDRDRTLRRMLGHPPG